MSDTLGKVASILQDTSVGSIVAKGALGKLSGALGTIDLFDQEVPVLGLITDGLTVATGLGSIIATAFDNPAPPPSPTKAPTVQVAQQYGA